MPAGPDSIKLFTFALMRKSLLKISSVLICGLLVYNSLGYFWVLSVTRIAARELKQARLSALPDSELTVFEFPVSGPNANFHRMNESEIRISNRLFDVVRTRVHGNSVSYYCYADKSEESLIAKTRLINAHSQPGPTQQKAKLIFEKIIKMCTLAQPQRVPVLTAALIHEELPSYKLITPVLPVFLPPPRTC
jgi:hypothetical protein